MLFAMRPRITVGDVHLYYRKQTCEMVINFNNNCMEREQSLSEMVTSIGNVGINAASSFSLVGSCNGLVCCKTNPLTFYPGRHRTFMYVSNPIVGERIRLPPIDTWCACTGFGYCHSIDTYKAFRIPYTSYAHVGCRVQVYTLGEGSGWRDKPEITDATYSFSGTGVFANGALHWLNERYRCDIVAFDLTDETFRTFPSPPPCHVLYSSSEKVHIGSLERDLYLCLQDECMMDIWIFKMNYCGGSTTDDSTWINVFSGNWDSDIIRHPKLLSLTGTEILLWSVLDDVLSCYDPKTFKKLWHAKVPRYDVHVIPHMNTLVSLKDLGEELVDCEDES